jgi:hypothetical protein
MPQFDSIEARHLENLAYEKWLIKVDNALVVESGTKSDDLPDFDYWSAYTSGASPGGAATSALANAGFYEFVNQEEDC